jgi:hypothetical protein
MVAVVGSSFSTEGDGQSGSSSGSYVGVGGGLSLRTLGMIGSSRDGAEDRDRWWLGRLAFSGLALSALSEVLVADGPRGGECRPLERGLGIGDESMACTEGRWGSSSRTTLFDDFEFLGSSACLECLLALARFKPDPDVPAKWNASFKLRGERDDSGVRVVLSRL